MGKPFRSDTSKGGEFGKVKTKKNQNIETKLVKLKTRIWENHEKRNPKKGKHVEGNTIKKKKN